MSTVHLDRINRLDRAISQISSNQAPTLPKYGLDSTPPAPPPPPVPPTLCGGIEAGPAATGIGGGTGTGATLHLALLRDVPCDGFLIVVTAAYILGGSITPGRPSITSITDSVSGGGWISSGTSPSIGDIGQNFGADPNFKSLLVTGRVKRITAGEFSAGDTVNVVWDAAAGTLFTVGMIFAITNIQFLSEMQSGLREYANGDAYPDNSSVSTRLNWNIDQSFNPHPDNLCAYIAAYASAPGGGSFTPNSGILVGSVTSTELDAFFTFASAVNSPIEPGAVWGSGKAALVANYQFVERL